MGRSGSLPLSVVERRITLRQLEVLVALVTSEKVRGIGARTEELRRVLGGSSDWIRARADRLLHWGLAVRDGRRYWHSTSRGAALLDRIAGSDVRLNRS